MSGIFNSSASSSSSDLNQIAQLLKEITSVQEKHTSMLRRVLEAATKSFDEPSPTAVALQALVTSTNSQTDAMKLLTTTMQNLPDQISIVMRTEVDRALNED